MNSIITMSKEDFNKYQDYYSKEILDIVLPPDMNPALSFEILSKIDRVYSSLRMDMSIISSEKDFLNRKISKLEKILGEGRNEKERFKDAVRQIESYTETGDNPVNLYNIYSTIYERYLIIQGFLEVLENKQKKMITYNGVMKIEQDLGRIH